MASCNFYFCCNFFWKSSQCNEYVQRKYKRTKWKTFCIDNKIKKKKRIKEKKRIKKKEKKKKKRKKEKEKEKEKKKRKKRKRKRKRRKAMKGRDSNILWFCFSSIAVPNCQKVEYKLVNETCNCFSLNCSSCSSCNSSFVSYNSTLCGGTTCYQSTCCSLCPTLVQVCSLCNSGYTVSADMTSCVCKSF